MNVYEMITDRIVSQLNQGIIPWHKPWAAQGGAISYSSRKPYSLLNQFLLGKDGEWLSFNDVQKAGGHIRKGEEGSFVVFWKWFTPKEDEDKPESERRQIPILKWYRVWHISQCDGVKSKIKDTCPGDDLHTISSAEDVVAAYFKREACRLYIERGDRAYYSPLMDEVHIPELKQFKSEAEYYSTLFHEMTHSTGHAKRLARKEIMEHEGFGSVSYSKEELVAEMGAAFLMHRAGIECDKAFKNSVAYIQSWSKQLRKDPKLFVSASSKAQRATDYIIDGVSLVA